MAEPDTGGDADVLREKNQRVDMAWPECAEMSVVEARELGFFQTLHDGQDRRIDEPNVGIVIPVAERPNTGVVRGLKVFDAVRARLDVVEEGDKNTGMQPSVNPVIHFDEHRRRDDQPLLGFFDEPPACSVVGVASVERRVQRPGIEDQRHGRGSGRSSPARRAVSECPDAPMPRLRGRGLKVASFSSTASRMSAAIEVRRSSAIRWRSRSSGSSMEMVVRRMPP